MILYSRKNQQSIIDGLLVPQLSFVFHKRSYLHDIIWTNEWMKCTDQKRQKSPFTFINYETTSTVIPVFDATTQCCRTIILYGHRGNTTVISRNKLMQSCIIQIFNLVWSSLFSSVHVMTLQMNSTLKNQHQLMSLWVANKIKLVIATTYL